MNRRNNAHVFQQVTLNQFHLYRYRPIDSGNVMIPTLLPYRNTNLFLNPIKRNSYKHSLYFHVPESRGRGVVTHRLSPMRKYVVVNSSLTGVRPRFLRENITTNLFLGLKGTSLPLQLTPTIFTTSFV